MEQQSIRVNQGIKINVNDEGDCIVAYVADQNFVNEFYNVVDKMNEVAEHMASEAVTKLDTREQLQVSIEKTKEVMAEIDAIFGESACEKIFGVGVVPSAYAMGELFEQLIPVFQSYADERQKKIGEKYNSNRKGNRQHRRHRGR